MGNSRFWIAAAVTFVVMVACQFVIHQLVLGEQYHAIANIFRPEADMNRMMPMLFIAHLIVSFAMVWIYDKGKEAKPFVQQGLKFGLAVAALTTIPNHMIQNIFYPLPCNLSCTAMLLETAQFVGLGVLVAKLRG